MTVITVESEKGTCVYRVYEEKDINKIKEVLDKYAFTDDEPSRKRAIEMWNTRKAKNGNR